MALTGTTQYEGRLTMSPTAPSVFDGLKTVPPAIYSGAVLWTNPDNGLWVATSRDGYLGMVEEIAGRFSATDPIGIALGSFDTLVEAKAIIFAPIDNELDVRDMRSAIVITGALTGACALVIALVTLWVSAV